LREIARTKGKVLEQEFKVFEAPDAYQRTTKSVNGLRFFADGIYSAENRQGGAMISIWRKPKKDAPKTDDKAKEDKEKPAKPAKEGASKEEKAKVTVLDMNGDTVRRFSTKVDTGFVRINWNMSQDGVRFPSRQEPKPEDDLPSGGAVLPGKYKLVFKFGKTVDSTFVNVLSDPRTNANLQQIRAKDDARKSFYKLVEKATKSFNQLKDAKKTLKLVDDSMVNATDTLKKEVAKIGKDLAGKIDTLMLLYLDPEKQKGLNRDADHLNQKMNEALDAIGNADGAPDQPAQILIRQAEMAAAKTFEKVNAFFDKDWKAYREKVEAIKMSLFKPTERW
jgi:hypothetical protein